MNIQPSEHAVHTNLSHKVPYINLLDGTTRLMLGAATETLGCNYASEQGN